MPNWTTSACSKKCAPLSSLAMRSRSNSTRVSNAKASSRKAKSNTWKTSSKSWAVIWWTRMTNSSWQWTIWIRDTPQSARSGRSRTTVWSSQSNADTLNRMSNWGLNRTGCSGTYASEKSSLQGRRQNWTSRSINSSLAKITNMRASSKNCLKKIRDFPRNYAKSETDTNQNLANLWTRWIRKETSTIVKSSRSEPIRKARNRSWKTGSTNWKKSGCSGTLSAKSCPITRLNWRKSTISCSQKSTTSSVSWSRSKSRLRNSRTAWKSPRKAASKTWWTRAAQACSAATSWATSARPAPILRLRRTTSSRTAPSRTSTSPCRCASAPAMASWPARTTVQTATTANRSVTAEMKTKIS